MDGWMEELRPLTAFFKVSPLWMFDGGQSPPAGRPVPRSPGQSGAEDLARLQVAAVVFPLRPFPGLAGVPLHLTPRLPPHVELQQSPFFTGGHQRFGAAATSNGDMEEGDQRSQMFVKMSVPVLVLSSPKGEIEEGAPKIVSIWEDEFLTPGEGVFF